MGSNISSIPSSSDSGPSAAARGYMDAMKSKLLVASVPQPVEIAVTSTQWLTAVPPLSSMPRSLSGEEKDGNENDRDMSGGENTIATATADNMSISSAQAVAWSANSIEGLDFSQSSSSAASAASVQDKQQDARSMVLTKEEIGI